MIAEIFKQIILLIPVKYLDPKTSLIWIKILAAQERLLTELQSFVKTEIVMAFNNIITGI